MEVLAGVIAIVFALLCVVSVVADFTMASSVVDAVDRLGLPRAIIPLCGISKACGAIGLMMGFGNDSLRLFAALALIVYFIIAVGAHVRRRDSLRNTAPAVVFLVMAAATLVTSALVV